MFYILQRQKLNQEFDDSSDSDDEQPQIVVTKTGDLSAEQVEAEKRRIESGKKLFLFFLLLWIRISFVDDGVIVVASQVNLKK